MVVVIGLRGLLLGASELMRCKNFGPSKRAGRKKNKN